jgi:two-component system response regulator
VTQSSSNPVEILLVEDDPADEQLAQEGLKDSEVPVNLNVVEDGVEALQYLRKVGPFTGVPRPDLVLLDLKIPKKSGLEVLAEMKADSALRRIPVIILTTSDAPDDVLKSYDLQASCFVRKPADLEEFRRVMASVKDFCLTVVKLPPRESASR